MRKISLAILMFHWLTAVTAQHYSKAVNEQIARVETNLSGGLIIDGKPFTLAERMKHFNVAGLTVAVIDNYQIVWAKGYGYADKKEGYTLKKGIITDYGFDYRSKFLVTLCPPK